MMITIGDGYINIYAKDGNVHVVPERVFRDIVDGKLKLTDIDDWELIIRVVILEWLWYLHGQSA